MSLVDDIIARVNDHERQGALIDAYDAVQQGLRQCPGELTLRHRAVLILARGGATAEAERAYAAFGLDQIDDNQDVVALGGRLLKDRALAAAGPLRLALAQAAIARYRQAFALTRSTYPAINVAALHLLSGDADEARHQAHFVLTQPAAERYYDWATRAEAQLILGRFDDADSSLARAVAAEPADIASRATTLRQLELLGAALKCPLGWLDRHRPPPSLHYCGHMFPADSDGPTMAALAAAIAGEIVRWRPFAMFGSLAAGCDIMAAEAALRAGVDLHVVLPFEEEDFLRCSVAPWGETWLLRYQACRAMATSFRINLPEPYLGDDSVFAMGSACAMGLAIRQAQSARAPAAQICVWDGGLSDPRVGTAIDQAAWAATGLAQTILPFPAGLRRAGPKVPPLERLSRRRRPRAILFGDVRGFGSLSERQAQIFFDQVMGGLAEQLRQSAESPILVESWGDGLHLVFDSVGKAAKAALALQQRFQSIALAELGLPEHLALRIGAHYGPLTPMKDPLTRRKGYVGTHNTIAARIEPVAMPGAVFASEPFAAMLALKDGESFQSGYVGNTELPKGFGAMRLYAIQSGTLSGQSA